MRAGPPRNHPPANQLFPNGVGFHPPSGWEQIDFCAPLHLYWRSPESGEVWHKSGVSTTRIHARPLVGVFKDNLDSSFRKRGRFSLNVDKNESMAPRTSLLSRLLICNSLIALVKNMLCSKLHCQKGFDSIILSCKSMTCRDS